MAKNNKPFAPFEDGEEMEDLPDLSITGEIDPFEIKQELGAKEKAAKVKYLKIVDLLGAIEGYNFTCGAGSLDMCVEWNELKLMIKKMKPK